MRSLIFFVIIIGIDIFLKSVKDKKKIEKERRKKMYQLRNQENVKTVKETDTRERRKVAKDPSLSKKLEPSTFFGEGKSYREDHEGYRDRYEKRYDKISESYQDSLEAYNGLENHNFEETLYDKHSIETRKEDKDADIRNYGRSQEEIDIQVPAGAFTSDVLKGIIFSEILGKPKSMQKKDI